MSNGEVQWQLQVSTILSVVGSASNLSEVNRNKLIGLLNNISTMLDIALNDEK